jgi:DNA-directed RNA polymerase specialized sigma subunit
LDPCLDRAAGYGRLFAQAQAGQDCGTAFHVLCLLFNPLILKSINRLLRHNIQLRDLRQEVVSTLFEAVIAFEWDRCKNEKFFEFFSAFIRQRLDFVPSWRIRKETRELPKVPVSSNLSVPDKDSKPYPDMEIMLSKIEVELGTKTADLVYCMFVLRMTQADAGKVFGVTQKGVNWWWKAAKPRLRKLLRGLHA